MSRTTTASATSTAKPQTGNSQPGIPPEKVAMLAYQKWVKAGCKHGCDQQHWYEAEAELKAAAKK